LEGEWRYSQQKLDQIMAAGEELLISKLPFRPNHIRSDVAPKRMKNLLSVAHFNLPTYEDATEETLKLFPDAPFDYPKPEKLILTLIEASTKPGDLVLDAFLGSGTTAAAAQKSGRKWIGIEAGIHCLTHAADRLKMVCQGVDGGGVTQETGWDGGGGFMAYSLRDH
jgi:adenine-specific DNA-methyltransferase